MVRSGLVLDKIAMLERKTMMHRGAVPTPFPPCANSSRPARTGAAGGGTSSAALRGVTGGTRQDGDRRTTATNNINNNNSSHNSSSEDCSSDENSSCSGSDSGSGSGSGSQSGSSCCPPQPGARARSLRGSSGAESSTDTSASDSGGSPTESLASELELQPDPGPAPAPRVRASEAEQSLHKLRRSPGRVEHVPAVLSRKPPSAACDKKSKASLRVHSSHESLLHQREKAEDDAMTRSLGSCGHHGSLDRRRHREHREHREHRHHREVKVRSALVGDWCCAPRQVCCGHHCCEPQHAPAPAPVLCSCYRAVRKGGDADERLRRLQAENERLQLQAAVLSERIDVQVDKMGELEAALGERKRALQQAEDLLQREMLSRSSLETQKLELLSSVTELKRQLVAMTRENAELRALHQHQHRPPAAPRAYCPSPGPGPSPGQLLRDASPCPGSGSPLHRAPQGTVTMEHAESYREIRDLARDIPPPRTPPATYRQRVQQYHSLPRDSQAPAAAGSPLGVDPASLTTSATNGTNNGISAKKGVAFADAERVVIQDETDRGVGLSLSPQPSPSLSAAKSKGIKKILGRMKRSGSGNLDDLANDGEFRRGGVRATAGGRLGWSSSSNALSARSQLPFVQWDREAVSEWLCSLGLEHCAQEGRGWIVSGAQLLSASPHDLEKELGIKNPLHRKKLRLALQERTDTGLVADPQLGLAGLLDTCWVLRWLDDTGLPQLKEQFGVARVDGRMLHRLTVDDLAALHVSSSLHVASLRTGIQVLRENRFDPNCLVRRSAPSEDIENGDERTNGDESAEGTLASQNREVVQWTNHRVMEWLRVVDLAEYAPNLRGSGVHGGLMVYEPRFTAELLASLLSIPPSKTLLRRHLNTHFKELLGKEAIQAKRQAEATLGYTPLTPTAKIKVSKKSQFSLKRQKTKSELEFGDLVCPLDNTQAHTQEASSGDRGVGDGTNVAVHPKLSVACPESDVTPHTQDSRSGRISTV